MTAHASFELLRHRAIESLAIEVSEYRHRVTGAMHYHLASDSDENVFLVALRTVPMDSTGVAHILEHTALCGSERFPVRDPFFLMLRRSLNTFMNAFTSSDWTAYPFASCNRKDFSNLLDVYLDAVFFSRLDPLDFAQEGHRLEFETPDDPASPLLFKGVVFNEMKGAMSSVPSTLWHTLCKYLYPTTTYHYNSGGDPEHIPDLSYQDLVDFYRSHYHPSNAIFATFGNIPAHEHQAVFDARALARFEALDVSHIRVDREKRYHAPLRVQEHYALDPDEDTADKTHIVVAWLLGESADLDDMLAAQLLTMVLLDNSSSPLLAALETSELGNGPSPLCGLEDSHRELTFVCGLEGSSDASRDAVEELILNVLGHVAEEGVPAAQLEAMLHQLELHQREIGGDGFPYGLQLIMNALGSATHRGDPLAVLDLEPALARLRSAAQAPDFIQRLAKRWLLDNPHRVTLVLSPDTQLAARRDRAERERLAEIRAGLDAEAEQQVVAQAKALLARQAEKPNADILPKVTLADVPADLHVPEGQTRTLGPMAATSFATGTNGLVYQQVVYPIPAIGDELVDVLGYYGSLVTELGVGADDYAATQARQAAVCGGFSVSSSLRGAVDDEQSMLGFVVLSSKALARNSAAVSQLLRDTRDSVRFDEHARIRDLIGQQRARREQSITGNGHGLAMLAACAGMSPVAAISHRLSGLAGIQAIKALDKSLDADSARQALAERLQRLHSQLVEGPAQALLVADHDHLGALESALGSAWADAPAGRLDSGLTARPTRHSVRELWLANTQVNFCAKAFPSVPVDHPDAAALTVLGGFLRNGFLHRAIREQGGAYGGGASQDNNSAAFRLYSYRDPRLAETLDDFDLSVRWLLDNRHDDEALEQAILGVISSLDKPGSPAGEAKQTFHNQLFGRSPAQRRRFRSRVLAVSLADLQRVAETYLLNPDASVAVVTNSAIVDALGNKLAAWDFTTQRL